ncbi:hypothetical protein B2I21_08500 [Chryseobacterium mucoviscidosis]|nr:hypothetical protein B2I21_08500 [Chryseobacterium mucoviscidosis]
MNGARKYHNIITEAVRRKLGALTPTKQLTMGGDSQCFQHENVIFRIASHARGKEFYIFLVNEDVVMEVYGRTGGNYGWTETYGWVKKGTWTKPILKYLRDLETEIELDRQEKERVQREREREQNRSIGEQVDHFNELFRKAH